MIKEKAKSIFCLFSELSGKEMIKKLAVTHSKDLVRTAMNIRVPTSLPLQLLAWKETT